MAAGQWGAVARLWLIAQAYQLGRPPPAPLLLFLGSSVSVTRGMVWPAAVCRPISVQHDDKAQLGQGSGDQFRSAAPIASANVRWFG